jgi:hypothetical protein
LLRKGSCENGRNGCTEIHGVEGDVYRSVGDAGLLTLEVASARRVAQADPSGNRPYVPYRDEPHETVEPNPHQPLVFIKSDVILAKGDLYECD